MDLSTAASYFANTTVNGWNGTAWIPAVAQIAILPSDRFISIHEFDTNCQYALTDVDATALDEYSVIQVEATQQVYLVGFKTYDTQQDVYSKFYLLRRADSLGELYQFDKTYAASGVARGVTRALVGEYFCDVEYVTGTPSRQFKSSKLSDVMIFMPSDCDLQTSHEVKVGERYYEVSTVYDNSGFKVCRAVAKRSA
jgi:hypothetical protein